MPQECCPMDSALPPFELTELASNLGPFKLQPRRFIVAWSGVIALAYDGWPTDVEAFKTHLAEQLPVKPESPGSRWPKTSLAALCVERRLTPEQLATMQELCDAATQELLASSWSPAFSELHSTLYLCRSHERLLTASPIPLCGPVAGPASAASQAYVDSVIAASDDLDTYWFQVSRDGSRENHYREAVMGSSLVAFLGSDPPGAAKLREQVKARLPGMYAWFSEQSLHCTLRALTP
eukprot:gnl/TRDRNA2_/TRDRNA2_65051_c0_seq1.p1 gnl/TRDRNA2_/TRDRNA2_65051_c0~~gnl/TRDRNA2_/TRDRNA2_65051_c0_seq1.p1  ORF type:complete len:237 (+),score=30.18 gnl/TRDRNA2_/TRDRNA2_65051_c0_seq1:42-752(+)